MGKIEFSFRYALVMSLVLFFSTGAAAYASHAEDEEQEPVETKDKKVALVLCGGGAKGAAHVGVLKVLEEAGVKIDMIVGTSIGGIVGGLYAMGYTANELDTIIRNLDWSYLLSNNTLRKNSSFTQKSMDQKYLVQVPFNRINSQTSEKSETISYTQLPSGVVNGQNIYNMINSMSGGYQDSIDFAELPIPFVCMATDLVTGNEVALDRGSLPQAMRATMAIPGIFSPITLGDKVLVDGGIVNNFPTDVARKMGADIVIGVDIQNDLFTAGQLQSITNVMGQIIGLMGNEKYEENIKKVDIYIKPNVEGYGTYSFSKEAIDTLINRGEKAAMAKKRDLEDLARKQNLQGSRYHNVSRVRKAFDISTDTMYVNRIIGKGITESDLKWLLREGNLHEESYITGEELNRAISIFYGTNTFSSISYKLQKRPDMNGQDLILEFKRGPANVFALGARFDSEEAASVLVHLGIKERDLFGSKLSITGRLSYNAYGQIEYSYISKNFPKLNLSYDIKHTDMNIYRQGEMEGSFAFISHKLELSLSNIYLRNFDFNIGIRYEAYNYLHRLTSSDGELFTSQVQPENDLDADQYLSYFAEAKMDNRDNKNFPTKGQSIELSSSLFQLDFFDGNSIFGTLALSFRGAVSIGKNITVLPAVFYRSYIGRVVYTPYVNFAGGSESGRYLRQQVPFIGINRADPFDRHILIGRCDLRGKIAKNHYLYAMVNHLREGNVFENLFGPNGSGYWGVGVKYAYSTPIGPISIDCHWSDYNHKVGIYFNMGYYF